MTPYTYSPLLTDLYQLTMAYGYWRLNMHEQEANFHLLFRKNPFDNHFALACGLASVIDYLQQWRFQQSDLDYLATLTNTDGERLFPDPFLTYLGQLTFTCDLEAIPEGTLVFPHEPLLRIQGPLLQCQLLESPLLTIMNFQTLVATKAARVRQAAGKDTVIEFGLRRAQGPDGALSASRAAYIGGCDATSNTLAGKLFDIPVRGTHAHSWVTAFPSETAAFDAYITTMPHNAVLLVDTYNTLKGVDHAIEAGRALRKQGAELLAIRLDSGDLAELSIQARKKLDAAGFKKTGILASNSLDEYVIRQLKEQGAAISMWGVGTNLVTAYDHPALDGIYKLGALRTPEGQWEYKLKLSEQAVKTSNPGRHQVRRFFVEDKPVMDIIYDLDINMSDTPNAIELTPAATAQSLSDFDGYVDLLKPIFKRGELIQAPESIHTTRKNALDAVNHFLKTHGDKPYSVGLEKKLFDLKQALVKQHRS